MVRELSGLRRMAKAATQIPGQIGASDLYTIAELKRRLGLSSWSMWKARRSGLKVYRISHRLYVLGKDFIAFVENTGM